MPTNETNNETKGSMDGEIKLIEAPNWDDIQTSRLEDMKFPKFEQQDESKIIDESNDFVITTAQELMKYKVQPEYFIINPLIPKESITAISAQSGAGKSLLVLIMAYQIIQGKKVFGEYEVEKTKVLYVDGEMNKNEIALRLQKIANDNIAGLDYMIDQNFKIDDPEDFNNLVLKIQKNNYGVIILDTLTTIHDKEENSSTEMKKITSQLLELIRQTKISVIFTHHNRKPYQGEKISQNSMRGSSEIVSKTSSHLALESKNSITEEGENALDITISQEKARSSKKLQQKVVIRIIDTEKKIRWEFLGEAQEKTKKVDEAKEKILEMLKEVSGLTIRDVLNQTDIKDSNLRSAFKELVDAEILDVGKQGQANYYFPATKN